MAPELLTAKWGSSKLRNLVWPFLATINTPIRPRRLLRRRRLTVARHIGQYDQALGETLIADARRPADRRSTPTASRCSPPDNARNRVEPVLRRTRRHPRHRRRPAVRHQQRSRRRPATRSARRCRRAGTPNRRELRRTFGRDTGQRRAPIYSQTAQITVPTRRTTPGTTKLVELYGVYSHELPDQPGLQRRVRRLRHRAPDSASRAGDDVDRRGAGARLQRDRRATRLAAATSA